MCGLVSQVTPPEHLARLFTAEIAAGAEHWAPDERIPVARPLLAIAVSTEGGDQGRLIIDRYRFGLIGSGAKAFPTGRPQFFNAKAETVDELPTFRHAFAQAQAVSVPVDLFYEKEWIDGKPGRNHYSYALPDGEPLALAGLYEIWHNPELGDTPETLAGTCTIITTTPNREVERRHPRMPAALLSRSDVNQWLGIGGVDPVARKALLRPAPDGTFVEALGNRPKAGPAAKSAKPAGGGGDHGDGQLLLSVG